MEAGSLPFPVGMVPHLGIGSLGEWGCYVGSGPPALTCAARPCLVVNTRPWSLSYPHMSTMAISRGLHVNAERATDVQHSAIALLGRDRVLSTKRRKVDQSASVKAWIGHSPLSLRAYSFSAFLVTGKLVQRGWPQRGIAFQRVKREITKN
jgi:hypothetical protein